MTKTELWLYTVEYVLSHHQDRQVEKYIRRLLDATGGDIAIALANLYANSGWFGYCGPNSPAIECWGNAPHTPVSAWLPGRDQFNDPPDLRVTWREIFEYVKSGHVPALQMSLFPEAP